MNDIYALYDKRSRKVVSLNIFNNGIVAYNHYFDLVERNKATQPNLSISDFSVLFLGTIDDESNNPSIQSHEVREVTREFVLGYYKSNPLKFDVLGEHNGF